MKLFEKFPLPWSLRAGSGNPDGITEIVANNDILVVQCGLREDAERLLGLTLLLSKEQKVQAGQPRELKLGEALTKEDFDGLCDTTPEHAADNRQFLVLAQNGQIFTSPIYRNRYLQKVLCRFWYKGAYYTFEETTQVKLIELT